MREVRGGKGRGKGEGLSLVYVYNYYFYEFAKRMSQEYFFKTKTLNPFSVLWLRR